MFKFFNKKEADVSANASQDDSKRKHYRHQRLFPLFIKKTSETEFIKVISHNISEGGLSFVVPHDFSIRTAEIFDVKMKLEGENYIYIKGEVRWFDPAGRQTMQIGIQFIALTATVKLEIKDFIQKSVEVLQARGLSVVSGRRQSLRKRIMLPMEVDFSKNEGFVHVKPFDISSGGVSFYYRGIVTIYAGQCFDARLKVPSYGWMDFRGRIMRIMPDKSGEFFVGARFINLDKQSFEIIKELISS